MSLLDSRAGRPLLWLEVAPPRGLNYKPLLDKGVRFYAALGNHDRPTNVFYAPFNMNGQRYYTFARRNVQFFVLDQQKLALSDLVATGFVGAIYGFTGLLIDQLLAQPVAGLAVDLAKRNPFRR